jgi:hypothetical protein
VFTFSSFSSSLFRWDFLLENDSLPPLLLVLLKELTGAPLTLALYFLACVEAEKNPSRLSRRLWKKKPRLKMASEMNVTDVGNDTSSIEIDMAAMRNLERIVSIVVPIFFSIVVVIGFFGNLLVVLVVTFNKQMRNTTNLLILNLAVADILFIVFCVPFTATGYALPHNWPFGDVW